MKKIVFFSLFFSLMIACKKEESTDITDDKMVAEDNSLAENASDDVSTMADEAYNSGKLTTRGGSGGNTILGDTVKITKNGDSTVTIDFGTTGIVGKDGKTRKGKIIIRFSNGYRKVSSVVTQTFDNYSVNNNQFSNTSTRSFSYKGLDTTGNHYWEINANISITKSNGKTIAWTSTRTRTMVAGANTPLNWLDDEYKITGSASGTNSNNHAYTLTITKALYIKVVCQYIQDGIITYTRGSRTSSIDYGYTAASSACDGQAEITYPNGTKSVINL